MMRIGGAWCDRELRRAGRGVGAPHDPHLDRAGVGAQQLALAVGAGLQEEGVVHLPRRMAGREVEGREVVEVVLDVRPFGHARSPSRRRWRSSRPSPAWSGGRAPLRRGGAGSERSSRPAASSASSAAASSSALRAAIAAATRSRRPLIGGPSTRRSSGLIWPRRLEQAGDDARSCPAPRRASASSASRSAAAAICAREVAFEFGVVGHWVRSLILLRVWGGRPRSGRQGTALAPAFAPAGTSPYERGSSLVPWGREEPQPSAARTLSAMALNAAGSEPAMSASTLRSISIPARSRP